MFFRIILQSQNPYYNHWIAPVNEDPTNNVEFDYVEFAPVDEDPANNHKFDSHFEEIL